MGALHFDRQRFWHDFDVHHGSCAPEFVDIKGGRPEPSHGSPGVPVDRPKRLPI